MGPGYIRCAPPPPFPLHQPSCAGLDVGLRGRVRWGKEYQKRCSKSCIQSHPVMLEASTCAWLFPPGGVRSTAAPPGLGANSARPAPVFSGSNPSATRSWRPSRNRHHRVPQTAFSLFKKPGRGWHRRAVEAEPTLSCGNGSHRAPELFPQPRVGSNGRSGEAAQIKAVYPFSVKDRRLIHTLCFVPYSPCSPLFGTAANRPRFGL